MPSTDAAAPPPLVPGVVRGLVFDLDGTLVDSYEAIAESLNHARQAFGLPALDRAFVRRRVGRGLESLIAELVGTDRVNDGVRLFREHYARRFAPLTRPLAGARQTLFALRERGYRLAVASNKPARFCEPILAALAMREPLDCVLGPECVGAAKPDPAMIRSCLSRMGVDVREGVYVGDMVLDVESAARAGVPVLLVGGGSSPTEALRGTGQRLLGSLGELLDLFPGPGA